MKVLNLLCAMFFYNFSKNFISTSSNSRKNKFDKTEKFDLKTNLNTSLSNENKIVDSECERIYAESKKDSHTCKSTDCDRILLSSNDFTIINQVNEQSPPNKISKKDDSDILLSYKKDPYLNCKSDDLIKKHRKISFYDIYVSHFNSSKYKLSILLDDEYFDLAEKIKILLPDFLIKEKINSYNLFENQNNKVLSFDDVFKNDFLNKINSEELRENVTLLYLILKKGQETGHFNKKSILSYDEAYYMFQNVLEKLIHKIKVFIDKKVKNGNQENDSGLEESQYLYKKLNEINEEMSKNFNYSKECDMSKNDYYVLNFLYVVKNNYDTIITKFISLIKINNKNLTHKNIIEILTLYDIMRCSLCFYIFSNFYAKNESFAYDPHVEENHYDDIISNINKFIISCFNFIVDQNFFLQQKYINVEDNLKYWHDNDLKYYFELDEFWLFSKDNIIEYLNDKIDLWNNMVANNLFSDLSKVDKIQKFIEDILMFKNLIDWNKLKLWIDSINMIRDKILAVQKSN